MSEIAKSLPEQQGYEEFNVDDALLVEVLNGTLSSILAKNIEASEAMFAEINSDILGKTPQEIAAHFESSRQEFRGALLNMKQQLISDASPDQPENGQTNQAQVERLFMSFTELFENMLSNIEVRAIDGDYTKEEHRSFLAELQQDLYNLLATKKEQRVDLFRNTVSNLDNLKNDIFDGS